MKKFIIALAMLTISIGANAQFEEGTKYVESAFNSIGLSYNGMEEFRFGAELKGGYFIEDQIMLNAVIGFNHFGKSMNQFVVGAGARYYIFENGFYGGVNVKGVFEKGHNDLMPGIEVGYAFFVNDKMTIEPAVYYDQSFSDHKNYSTVGLKIGIGLYF